MKRIIGASLTDELSVIEKENAQIAYRAALESIVLLKSDGRLPLKNREVAVFGVGASHTIKGGTGSGEVNNRHSVSIYEGLKNVGFNISSEGWITEYNEYVEKAHQEWIEKNTKIPTGVALATVFVAPNGREILDIDIAKSDKEVAIYVVSRRAGESFDRKLSDYDFNLRKSEVNDIRYLYEHFKQLIVVINSGSVMDITELEDMDISIVYYCMAGQEGGRALGDLLIGEESFSGKLTDTWAKKYDDIPFSDEFGTSANDKRNEYYREGIYVGYRYFDSLKVEPRFCFGYGLTYSTFNLDFVDAYVAKTKVFLKVEVENTGKYQGKEVVEVFVSCPNEKMSKEYKRIVAFKKSKNLKPGEKDILDICFDMKECASYDEENATFLLEKGNNIIRVGNSSDNTVPVVVVETLEDIIISKHEHIFEGREKFAELNPEKLQYDDDLTNLKRLVLNASDFKTVEYTYGKKAVYSDEKVDAILSRLSDDELLDVILGTGMMSMIDSKVFFAPGCAGRTTRKHLKKGLLPVVLADGPAGLRLVQKAGLSKNGHIKIHRGHYFASFMEIIPRYIMRIFEPSKRDATYYQFATAFPVGACLAQSWNEDLIEEVGFAVSKEMDKYNITYWLAPGMNIHKNPLCGRNFEYYSEDPFLTGKISAAMTKGVQKIEGNYTTIKHFCCNNTAEDCHKSNSHISERALREIYLRGFEINIREADSKSVMTSYNMVNGVYAPDSYDLCTKILRNEWGFDGVVMTDWEATNPDERGHTDIAVSNGNDMIMPGGKSYKKILVKGLKAGTLSREDVRRAAANIIKSIVYSNVAKKVKPEDFKEVW